MWNLLFICTELTGPTSDIQRCDLQPNIGRNQRERPRISGSQRFQSSVSTFSALIVVLQYRSSSKLSDQSWSVFRRCRWFWAGPWGYLDLVVSIRAQICDQLYCKSWIRLKFFRNDQEVYFRVILTISGCHGKEGYGSLRRPPAPQGLAKDSLCSVAMISRRILKASRRFCQNSQARLAAFFIGKPILVQKAHLLKNRRFPWLADAWLIFSSVEIRALLQLFYYPAKAIW